MNNKIKTKLKVGHKVIVISGDYKRTIDYISRIDYKKQTVYLKKISRKKYSKSSEVEQQMIPIHISNVAYYDDDKKSATKLCFQEEENEKVRKSRKYGTKID